MAVTRGGGKVSVNSLENASIREILVKGDTEGIIFTVDAEYDEEYSKVYQDIKQAMNNPSFALVLPSWVTYKKVKIKK